MTEYSKPFRITNEAELFQSSYWDGYCVRIMTFVISLN